MRVNTLQETNTELWNDFEALPAANKDERHRETLAA
jgi:hypothetical protein